MRPTTKIARLTSILLPALILVLAAAGCSGLLTVQPIEPLPSATPEPTLTPTPTIVWFPPTSTPTPLPTREIVPTPVMLTGVGAAILEDPMNRPGPWQVTQSDLGRIVMGKNELSIAMTGTRGTLFSYRNEPALDNFYVEVTSATSLCRGEDAYGLLFRSSGPDNTYRFAVSCDGRLRVERVYNYQGLTLLDWTPSGQVPMGAPVELRLGVWANDKELRFFINGAYQFTVTDPALKAGSIGVFARATGSNAVTVNFRDLAVYALNGQ